jgi:hypothetical protein
MKVVSKSAMVIAWAHVVWISMGLAAPAAALGQTAPAASSPAPSSPGGDVIELKTGGLLRGTLIDAIPNGHARIQLVTGEVATVPWQDIARIDRGSVAAPPAPAAPAAPTDATVYVHIEGSDAAQLQRDTGDHRHWDSVCSAPCDQQVSLNDTYRISGAGIRNSAPFTLSVHGGQREVLTVDEGSKAGFVLGIVGVSVGSFAATIGLLVVLVSSAVDAIGDGTSSSSRNDSGNGEAIGWTITGVGLAALVGGIVAIATNGRTGVSQTSLSASPAGLARTAPSVAFGPWVPSSFPAFHALSGPRREAAAPPVVNIPLVSARF